MAETPESAYSSLGEQARKIDIALYHTFGDMDKAKQILAGTYKDVYVIKAKFSSSTIFGAFISFANFRTTMVNSVYPIVSHAYEVQDIKTNQDWRNFEREIKNGLDRALHDDVLCRQFADVITRALDPQMVKEVHDLVESKSEIEINRLFQRLCQDKLSYQAVTISVDIETISSLDMELLSTSSKKIDPVEVQRRKDEEAKKNVPKIEAIDDEEEALKGHEIKLMMRGALVLSPIRGKDINQIQAGERVMISILDTHARAVQVIKAFNAYNDGNFKPIPGRIITIRQLSDKSFKIVAVVAKGIFVRITEEQGNIKIALESTPDEKAADNEPMSKRAMVLLGVLAFVLFAMVGAIIFIMVR